MRVRASLLVAAVVVSLASCGAPPFYGTALVTDQAGEPSAKLDPTYGIVIPEGSAASAHIEFDARTGQQMNGDLQSRDPSILQIFHTPGDGMTYVFLGVKAGLAEVVILTDGVAVRSVNAVVLPPPFATSSDAGADAGEPSDAGDAGTDAALVDGGEADASDAGSDSGAVDASEADASDAGVDAAAADAALD